MKRKRSIFGNSGIRNVKAPSGQVWKMRTITRGKRKGQSVLWW